MPPFIPYPGNLSLHARFSPLGKAELKQNTLNMIVGNVFASITLNKPFKSISTHLIAQVCFLYDLAFFIMYWSLRATNTPPDFGRFSLLPVFVPDLVYSLLAYPCNLAGLVLGSTIIEHSKGLDELRFCQFHTSK